MSALWFFDLPVLIILLGAVYTLSRLKLKYGQKLELSVAATILLYRVSTLVFLLLGGNFGSHSNNPYAFDHKWLGVILVLVTILLWPRKKYLKLKPVILGVGIAMIIDEISEFIELLGIKLPPGFRDSFPDLVLILLTFGIFMSLRRLWLIKSIGEADE